MEIRKDRQTVQPRLPVASANSTLQCAVRLQPDADGSKTWRRRT